MADISDVESVMVQLIADALHLGSNYLAGSVVGSPVVRAPCRVYRGWPSAPGLDKDIAGGVVDITVFPVAGASRRDTKYFPQWNETPTVAATLVATVDDGSRDIVFSGVPSASQVVAVRFGRGPGDQAYTYRVTASDTLFSIAAALSAAIPQSTVTGPILTVPTADLLQVEVVADQSVWVETRRQEQQVWVTIWAPSPVARDTASSAVDGGLGNMLTDNGDLTDQFQLPDGSFARVQYISSHSDDNAQRQSIWRRDLRYIVCYPTTLTQTFTPLLLGLTNDEETTFVTTEVKTITGPDTL